MEGSLETKLFFIGGTRNPTASLPPHRKTNALSGCKVILRCFRLPDKAQRAHTAHAPEFAVLHRDDADVAAASPS